MQKQRPSIPSMRQFTISSRQPDSRAQSSQVASNSLPWLFLRLSSRTKSVSRQPAGRLFAPGTGSRRRRHCAKPTGVSSSRQRKNTVSSSASRRRNISCRSLAGRRPHRGAASFARTFSSAFSAFRTIRYPFLPYFFFCPAADRFSPLSHILSHTVRHVQSPLPSQVWKTASSGPRFPRIAQEFRRFSSRVRLSS